MQKDAADEAQLGLDYYWRYEASRDPADLTAAIGYFQQAVALTAVDALDRAGGLGILGIALVTRYDLAGDTTDLEAAIALFQQAVALTADGSPVRAARLNILGDALSIRYEASSDPADLTSAIANYQQAVALTADGSPDRASRLNMLGNVLVDRYDLAGDPADLTAAIARHQQAVALTADDAPDRASRLNNLGVALVTRYDLAGDPSDLEATIGLSQQAVALTAADSPDRASRLNNLGRALVARYKRAGDPADLTAAIGHHQEAVALTSDGSPDKARRLSMLGSALSIRYDLAGDPSDLEATIGLSQQAVALTADGSPDRASRLNNLGRALVTRYKRAGDPSDLTGGIAHLRQAVALTADGLPDRATWLNNLGIALRTRYERTGDPADLTAAIGHHQEAVALTADGSPDRARWLNNLGIALRTRYERTGDPADLTEAIGHHQEAVALTADGSPDRASQLNNLGNILADRYDLAGDPAELATAIGYYQQAVALTAADSPDLATRLTNLGIALVTRCERVGDPAELATAIGLFQEAVALTADGSPDKATWLSNLGNALVTRYKRAGDPADLKTSLAAIASSVELHERFGLGIETTSGQLSHVVRTGHVYHLAILLCIARAEHGHRDEYVRRAWAFAGRARAQRTRHLLQQTALASETEELTEPQQALLAELARLDRERAHLLNLLSNHTSLDSSRSLSISSHLDAERQARFTAVQSELDGLWQQLVAEFPHLGPVRDLSLPDLPAVQQALLSLLNTIGPVVQVELVQLAESLEVFILDGERLRHHQIAVSAAEVTARTEAFTRLLDNESAGGIGRQVALERALLSSLAWLSEHLWPVLEMFVPTAMPEDDVVPHLLLVPSGALQRWPVAALPIPGTNERLLDRCAVQVLPAADAILAPPAQAANRRVTALVPAARPTLPCALPEGWLTVTMLGGDPDAHVLRGDAATYAALTGVTGGVVLVATHASLLLDAPEHSVLQLSDGAGGLDYVSGLRLLAGFGTRRRLQLVVLSACETHGGSDAGENWSGLTQALLAGTEQLVASQWFVGDEVALAVSAKLWEGIGAGLTVAQALRRAVRWVRDAEQAELLALGEQVMEELPEGEREAFAARWWGRHKVALELGAPYGGLSWWTPWLAIGTPARLLTSVQETSWNSPSLTDVRSMRWSTLRCTQPIRFRRSR